MRKVYLLVAMIFVVMGVWGQASLTNGSPSLIIDFSSSTPAGVGTSPGSAYTAAGFSPNPTTTGRLNSNAWAVTGWSDGSLAFAGSNTTGDYARGATAAAQTTGGFFAYTGAPGSAANPAFMIQPGGSDWAPGTITLRIQNNGATNITQLDISYNIYVRNDQARSSSFNFSHSADNVTYTAVGGLDYTSTAALDALGWVLVGSAPSRATSITGLNIAPGGFYYIRWSGGDVGGSGSRDEFGLDDISLAGVFAPPPTPTTTVITPNSAIAGGSGFVITVDGTNFINGLSTVRWNGSARTTSFVNATQLTANILAGDIASPGSIPVDILNTGNPTASNAQSFTINAGGSPTIVASATSLPSFGAVVFGNNSTEQSYTVSGTDLTANLVVTPPAGVALSLSSGTGYLAPGAAINLIPGAGTVATTTIYARFSPLTATGFLFPFTITNASTGATTKNVTTQGFAIDVEPTVQSNITFGTITTNSIDLNFSGGNGTGRVVVARQGSAVNADPADGPSYLDGAGVFGDGAEIGTGNFVVYWGTGNTVSVSNLVPGTNYYFSVYEYKDNGGVVGAANYLTPGNINNTSTTTPTYTWNVSSGSWITPGNWTPARTTPSASDILIFNPAGSTTVTGIPTQTIAKLSIAGGIVTFNPTGTNTLTITGSSGTDLDIASGASLLVDNGTGTILTMLVGAGATGAVGGEIIFTNGAHRLLATDAGSIIFNNGSYFIAGTAFAGNPFGSLPGTGALNSVLFTNGSTYVHQAGSNPFGGTAGTPTAVFQPGSIYKITGTTTPAFSGRSYANVQFDNPAGNWTLSGTAAVIIDTLSVFNGTVNIGMTGAPGHSIKGNIYVEAGATLNFNPASAGTMNLNGTVQQLIEHDGTITFNNSQVVVLNNAAGFLIDDDLSFTNLTMTSGKMDINAHNVAITGTMGGGSSSSYFITSGAGTVTRNNINGSSFLFPVGPSSTLYHPVTLSNAGTVDNFSVKVASVDPFCAPGLTSVNATWDISEAILGGSNCTVSLDYTGAATGAGYDPAGAQIIHCGGLNYHNGSVTGTVATGSGFTEFSPFGITNDPLALPVKFANVKAYQQGSGIKIDWSNLTESQVANYKVERSADGTSFAPLSSVNPSRNDGNRADYSVLDASPLNGVNFYRVQALEFDGKRIFSAVIRVNTKATMTGMVIYPNPVSGNQVSFQATQLPKGEYTVRIFNATGQQLYTKTLLHNGGSVTEQVQLPATIKPGIYSLRLTGGETNLTQPFIVR